MSIAPPNQTAAGFRVITKGVNSGVAPSLLPEDQLAWAVNTITRDLYPTHRPGWSKVNLKFLAQDGTVDTTLKDNFEDGLFAGAGAYESRNMLTALIGGRLFSIKVGQFNVQDVSIAGDLNPNNRPRAWFAEAAEFMVVQDGQSNPLIYDGASTRRADSAGVSVYEVPVGTCMVYSQGRLWVTLADQKSFVAGDLIYSSSGTQKYGGRDAVLKFTENTYIAENFSFGVPFASGDIVAMVPIAQVDTSTGQGPLQVFCEKGAFSVNAPFDRTQWQLVSFPVQSVSMHNAGATSDRASVNVNGDIWFRAQDGVRSFIASLREFNTWTNTPLSKEVTRQVVKDDPNLLSFASAVLFDNRLLMTCSPYRVPNRGVCHSGLLVLDFNPLGLLGNQGQPPVWEGLWCGIEILQVVRGMFDGVERCFAFALGADGVELWELTKDHKFDYDGTKDRLIQWELETPAYAFESGPFSLKQLAYGEMHYDNLGDDATITVTYRPDQDPNWYTWGTVTSCAKIETCLTSDSCTGVPTLGYQYRQRVRLPELTAECNQITGMPFNYGYEFSARLTIAGALRLNRWRLWASDVPEETQGSCQSHH